MPSYSSLQWNVQLQQQRPEPGDAGAGVQAVSPVQAGAGQLPEHAVHRLPHRVRPPRPQHHRRPTVPPQVKLGYFAMVRWQLYSSASRTSSSSTWRPSGGCAPSWSRSSSPTSSPTAGQRTRGWGDGSWGYFVIKCHVFISRAFRNLEELFIFNTIWGNITEGMLRQLLSSTKLRYVWRILFNFI